jgi:hypothetical protein
VAKITSKTQVEVLAALVSQALSDAGIPAVLSGGATVSIYTRNEYESGDLDFISSGSLADIELAMKTLGFERQGRAFVHKQTSYFVEFPPGPLAIGDELIRDDEVATVKTKDGAIRLLTPTQCVMNRLAAFFHWNDLQSLDQAVLVAKRQKVSMAKIKAWSKREGASEKFSVFLARMRKS